MALRPARTAGAPDLMGEWWPAEEVDEDDSVTITYHAVIEDERIYLYLDVCGSLGESGSSLWWVGTYVAPTADGAYTWESELDAKLLAELADGDDVSSEENMKFTYDHGVLSFADASLSGEDVVTELVQG